MFVVLSTYFLIQSLYLVRGQFTPDPFCPYPSTETTYYPDPDNCNQWIECNNGIQTIIDCSPGLWWNPNINACDWPGDFCWEPLPDCPEVGLHKRPIPGVCDQWVYCMNGQKLVFRCEEGLWYNPYMFDCEPPGDFCTPSTTIAPTPNCGQVNEYLPHPTSCSMYIECFNGDAYEMSCPKGLYYSEASIRCVDKSLSECCVNYPSKCT